MKNAVCVLLVLLTGSPVGAKVFYVHPPDPSTSGIMIDHNCVDLSAIPQIHIAPAASLRLLFRHASVGQGIGWGLDCFAGLHPTNSECSCYSPGQYPRDNWVLELRAGNWKDKVDDLVTQAETRTDEFDVFTMKFCYIDALGDSHPGWDYYRTAMEQLELDYPDKVFVWWTIPLTRDGMPGTDFFNALVRSYCRANGKILFDIADIECHDPNGLKQTNAQGNEVICPDYTKEIHAGHLNVPGRIRVASALWQLMTSIVGWHEGSIQAAIDAASNGDTILVTPGTYTSPGNRDIDFLGKAITLRSTEPNDPNIVASTIIDCNGTESDPHRGFYFHNNEDANCVVDGFTIINGCDLFPYLLAHGGGGIRCEFSSPTIKNNIIKMNCGFAGGGISCLYSSAIISNNIIEDNGYLCSCYPYYPNIGAGIFCYFSDPVIINNTIMHNRAESCGGGMVFWYCSAKLINNIIAGNMVTDGDGGGIHCRNSSLIMINNTIAGNFSPYTGWEGSGGVITIFGSSAEIINSIIWNNYELPIVTTEEDHDEQIFGITFEPRPVSLSVRYSAVQGGWPGEGNIDVDPCFVNLGRQDAWTWFNGDYHLKSQAGRWDAKERRWTIDEVTSPCIDAGDPMTPIGLEPFRNGGRINMGAYGGTAEASKSYFGKPPCEIIVAGDINGDCIVNLKDFAIMALHWLEQHQ